MICLGRSLIAPSQCPTGLIHSHPPAPCVRCGRWRAQVHTPVLRCLARVTPHFSLPWSAFLSDFQSPSRSSTGSLSRQPSLRSRAADDAAISNQTIIHPGDPRVIAPSRSSSLRRTSSMTDLGEEFKYALRRAKDARPGLGFGVELAGAIIGESSPVAVSSGSTLGRNIFVTPSLIVLVDLVLGP
jgi:hypothetical protein